jgi:hypothetical protein
MINITRINSFHIKFLILQKLSTHVFINKLCIRNSNYLYFASSVIHIKWFYASLFYFKYIKSNMTMENRGIGLS